MNNTKAGTLLRLTGKLKHANILSLTFFTVKEWRKNQKACLDKISLELPKVKTFAVRSSSLLEDLISSSNAGKFHSELNVPESSLATAIEKVIDSYGNNSSKENEILIQPMLNFAILSGVLFTIDPNTGAPYFIINYETNGDTTAVTSGNGKNLETLIIAKCFKKLSEDKSNFFFSKLLLLAEELILLFKNEALDIEFAFDASYQLYLLQVRPLVTDKKKPTNFDQAENLEQMVCKIKTVNKPHPYLHGSRTILGVMPDWNPAEMIGIHPKPLSLSLYKELITDSTWAYQRDNYGYKNLRSFPLLIDLMGIPFIDVRVSFNSFIPKDLDIDLSNRLVNYYINRLESNPFYHDKIEFEIAFSCYTFDLDNRIADLANFGFHQGDISSLTTSLKKLTNKIIHPDQGLWLKDTQKVEELKKRHELIYFNDTFDDLTKIYWLIEDCKRYGTLPFAGLARAGFIAVQILNSMVNAQILTSEQRLLFLNSLNSVSTQMNRDLHSLDQKTFIMKYGHLRPGTYDILSLRYDEAPDQYFDWKEIKSTKFQEKENFQLTLDQMKKIDEMLCLHGLEHNVVGLFSFMKSAIEGREYSKFVFTKTLSDVLVLLKNYAIKNDILPEDISYLDIKDILRLHSSSWHAKPEILNSINRGKEKFSLTNNFILPPLIINEQDVYCFVLPENKPNFVTKKSVTARVVRNLDQIEKMKNAIIFIPSADPGYDWIFTHHIAGFVTAYGGVNSHMAIRAGELGLPAVIGAGEKLYSQWVGATKIHLDCMNQRVEVLH